MSSQNFSYQSDVTIALFAPKTTPKHIVNMGTILIIRHSKGKTSVKSTN